MIYALILSTILLIKNPVVVEPIEIAIDVHACEIVTVEEEKSIKCDLQVICNGVNKGEVEIYIAIPKEEKENER